MRTRSHHLHWIVMGSIFLLPYHLLAQDAAITLFRAGDIISAEDVNANFAALLTAIRELRHRVSELEQENQSLKHRIAILEATGTLSAGNAGPQATPSIPSATTQIRLRSEPLTVSESGASRVFGINAQNRPVTYIENTFELRGAVVIDHATGLMWPQSGSQERLTNRQAQTYINDLNRRRFAGYSDWRLPTVAELLSLLEPTRRSNELYLDPIFDSDTLCCWTSDFRASTSAWVVFFDDGNVVWNYVTNDRHVRAVRSR